MKKNLIAHRKLSFVTFIFILVFGFSIHVHAVSTVGGNLTGSISEESLIVLTNKERLKNNLAPLVQNDSLQKAAELKADDMISSGYFSHNTPDGKLPWHWLDKAGYKYESAGENLAVKFFDSKKAIKAWMNSPTHKQNILNKKYTQTGIAVAEGVYDGKETVFVVQFFGEPKKQVSLINIITNQIKSIVSHVL